MKTNQPRLLSTNVGPAIQAALSWKSAVKTSPRKEDKIVEWLKQLGYGVHTRPYRWENGELLICGAPMREYILGDNYVAVRYACYRKHGHTMYGGKIAPLVPLSGLFDDRSERTFVERGLTFWGSVPFIGFPRESSRKKAIRTDHLKTR